MFLQCHVQMSKFNTNETCVYIQQNKESFSVKEKNESDDYKRIQNFYLGFFQA